MIVVKIQLSLFKKQIFKILRNKKEAFFRVVSHFFQIPHQQEDFLREQNKGAFHTNIIEVPLKKNAAHHPNKLIQTENGTVAKRKTRLPIIPAKPIKRTNSFPVNHCHKINIILSQMVASPVPVNILAKNKTNSCLPRL